MERKAAPVFLTGFSGAGKTTIGRALAFKLDRPFFDLDQEIEILSGSKIETLMREQGEPAFRKLESQILNSLAMTEGSIIALGGGALMSDRNLDRVLASGFVVYLESTMDRIKDNLQRDSVSRVVRPLICCATDQDLEKLFSDRLPGYQSAHLEINMDGLSIQQACDQVQEGYALWQKKLN